MDFFCITFLRLNFFLWKILAAFFIALTLALCFAFCLATGILGQLAGFTLLYALANTFFTFFLPNLFWSLVIRLDVFSGLCFRNEAFFTFSIALAVAFAT